MRSRWPSDLIIHASVDVPTAMASRFAWIASETRGGHLCCHYAIRTLMWEAALDHDIDPVSRVSFTQTLRIVRRSISAARDFSPSE